tara:strand:+ start:81 stop:452 length:372 start_codon:yes stop_codon:yes gene_type:complete
MLKGGLVTNPEHAVLQQHRASVVFGLGLSSLIINVVGCCTFEFLPFALSLLGFVLGILGWIFGRHDLRAMRNGSMDASGYSTTKSGKTLGMLAIFLSLVSLAIQTLMILGVIAAIGLAGAAGV